MDQHLTMYAGDSKKFHISITDETGAALDITGAVFQWILNSNTPVTKTGTITGESEVTVELSPQDTQGLSGVFAYEMEMTDAAGNVSTVLNDIIIIKKDLI